MQMSLTEWSVRLGLYTTEQAIPGGWFGRHYGPPKSHPQFDPQVAWRAITHPDAPNFIPSTSTAVSVRDPALRLAQVFLSYNFLGQANTSANKTLAELFFMWCMQERGKVHLGYWLAHSCHQIATHSTRHLNICHILDPLIRHGFNVLIQIGCRSKLCPKPELFDVNFFVRVKILKTVGDDYIFYTPDMTARAGSPHEQRAATPVEQRARPQERTSRKKRPETRMVVIDEDEGTGSSSGWQDRVERLLNQLVDIADAQRAQVARAVVVMEEMLQAVREGTVPQPRQATPHQAAPSRTRPDQTDPRQRK